MPVYVFFTIILI